MAAAPAYLHIQTGDDATTGVLELGTGPIRVGRGIQCEVRLNQVGLGDVQCLIRRRGDEWQVQPVGPPGRVWVNGRATDQQRPLPVGAPLRVGRSTLTIVPSNPDHHERGSFDAPINVNAEPVDRPPPPAPVAAIAGPPVEEPIPPPTGTDAGPTNEPEPDPPPPNGPTGSSPADDRVKRWQNRLDQRDQWLKDRQSEKRWEARWKAAGETIRARADQPAPPPPATSSSPPINPRPLPPGRSAPVRTFEPRPVFGHTRRGGDLEAKAEPRRVPLRAPAAEPAPSREPAAFEVVSRAADLPHAPAEIPPVPPVAAVPPAPVPVPIALPTADFDEVEAALAALAPVPEEFDSTDPVEPIEVEPAVAEAVAADDLVASGDLAVVGPAPALAGPAEVVVSPPVEPPAVASTLAVEPAPVARRQPSSSRVNPGAAPAAKLGAPRAEPKDWPSARSIFAAQGTRPTGAVAAATGVGPARRERRAPEPTAAVAPDGWSIPLALGWLPAAAAILVLGGFTVGLAALWVTDATNGNLAIRMATRPEGSPGAVDPQIVPDTAWWRTTASHLAAWALTTERLNGGKDQTVETRAFEADARSVSPLGARARFLVEPVLGREADGMASIRLGPTRDVITLTAMAHRLRRENKRADAIRAYKTAFLTASTTARSTLGRPVFPANPTNRFALPHSTLLDDVARAMARSGEWTAEEWATAVPEFAPARLAVAAAVRVTDPAEADRRLDAIAQAVDQPLDPRFDGSEHRAAIAEALAERGRWADSMVQYRRAIDGETRDTDRRVWWFNLAEVARKHGDTDTRDQAIEAAKGTDLSDEVTQRAANAHRITPETNLSARNR